MAQGKQAKSIPNSRGPNTAAIKVLPARGKRIRIVAGTRRTLVDLTNDVAGCLKLYDSHPPKWIGNQPLGIKVIDSVRKDDKYYLVLLTSAQGGCNVTGYCGAATDHTLIWLKLGAGLKLEKKTSAVIEDCKANVYMAEPEDDRLDESPIKLVSGKLTIEYGQTLDGDIRTLSRLVYDRNSPEQSFVITDKEKKSQQER
ncbi:MAG TPA: hypothetical protein VFS27_12920 [Blastocatellia bacterium]|nr:hypothetical protein [Blastocatellia bacterium]